MISAKKAPYHFFLSMEKNGDDDGQSRISPAVGGIDPGIIRKSQQG